MSLTKGLITLFIVISIWAIGVCGLVLKLHSQLVDLKKENQQLKDSIMVVHQLHLIKRLNGR